MTQQPSSLSGFWRVNKSHDRAVELKQLQEALQSLAGTLAKSKGKDIRVVWDHSLSTEYVDHKGTSVFALDASPVMDAISPVPDSRVDVLAGQVLHHVGHMIIPVHEIMRNKIIANILRDYHYRKLQLPEGSNAYSELGIIGKVIQEWQIDTCLSGISPAIRDYIAAARNWYRDAAQDRIQNAIDRCAAENPTFKDVVDLWSLILCYNLPVPDKIDPKVADALVDAIMESGKLTKHTRYIDGVVGAIWRVFNVFPRSIQSQDREEQTQEDSETSAGEDEGESTAPAPLDRQGEEGTDNESAPEESADGDQDGEGTEEVVSTCPVCGEPSNGLFDQETRTCEACGYSETPPDIDTSTPGYFASAIDQPQAHLDQEEIQNLKDAIESEREDISASLGGFAGSYHGKVIMQLAPSDSTLARRLISESKEEGRALTYLFQNWRRAKTRYIRGLEDGSLDRRLLYRGGLRDNHVFRARQLSQKLDMALCVLIDASCSIGPGQWDIITHCAAAFVESMGSRTDVDLIVLGYNSTAIYRVWDPTRREFRINFRPDVSTPTAQAIAACQDVIFKRFSRRKDKLIIHITDALPDDALTATQQIQRACKSGIQVALVRTPSERSWEMGQYQQHIDESYGRNCVDVKDWRDLPDAMEDLMRVMLAQR